MLESGGGERMLDEGRLVRWVDADPRGCSTDCDEGQVRRSDGSSLRLCLSSIVPESSDRITECDGVLAV